MAARDTYNSSIATNHASVTAAGVSSLPGLSPTGNQTAWTHAIVEAEFAAGRLTQAQRVERHQALAGYEEAQNDSAFSTLRGTPDPLPR